MNYLDFFNEEKVKYQYSKIDSINPYSFNHGLKHIKNVCNIMKDLCSILKIDEAQTEALLIACVLHDLGQADGRENHGKKSKDFIVREYNDILISNIYYNDILESIEKHSDIEDTNLSLFCLLVQASDKLDFSKERLEYNYRERFGYRCYEDINKIDIIYNDTQFGINIITNNIDSFEDNLLQEKHPHKAIKVLKKLANKLNRDFILLHNGNIFEEV